MNEIQIFYDEQYDEWSRFDRHPIEFDVTKTYLDRYLPAAPARVLDIGGGPGRYSLYLAEKGHRVTLFDLSGKHVNEGLQRAKAAGLELEAAVQGDALELDGVAGLYDAVLLMGPLYHLTEAADRRRAVERALAVLKPGGVIFAAFISAYAVVMDYMYRVAELPSAAEALQHLTDGRNTEGRGFTTSYFTLPEEARALMAGFSLEPLAFASVENVLLAREGDIAALPRPQYEEWLKIALALAEDPLVQGSTGHYLYVGRKHPQQTQAIHITEAAGGGEA